MRIPSPVPLEPCPFCGSEAHLYHNDSSEYETLWSYGVECSGIINRIDTCSCSISGYPTAEQAAKMWNRRWTTKQGK